MNYTAILLCGVAAMVIGFLWYGPLFGKAYMEVMGTGSMSAEQKAAMKKSMWAMYFIQFVLALATAWGLARFINNWAGPDTPLSIGLSAWFAFIMTTEAGMAIWSGKPRKLAWRLFFLSAGAQLVTVIVFSYILRAWM